MPHSASPIVVVTGATSGIGYETARQLLEIGTRVIVHGPTKESAVQAAVRLFDEGANPSQVEVAAADYRHLDEVRAMAREISDRHSHIDALVNNAAVAAPEGRTTTGDGNELVFQVNYLAPYLLTRLLADRLRASHGRMIAISSNLHRTANLDWSDLQRTRRYRPLPAYAQSKLALTMFARAIGTRDSGFIAASVHPGVAETGLKVHYRVPGQPVAEVAAPVVRLATASGPMNGAYYEGSSVAPVAPLVANASVDRLWKLSARLVGLDAPRVVAA